MKTLNKVSLFTKVLIDKVEEGKAHYKQELETQKVHEYLQSIEKKNDVAKEISELKMKISGLEEDVKTIQEADDEKTISIEVGTYSQIEIPMSRLKKFLKAELQEIIEKKDKKAAEFYKLDQNIKSFEKNTPLQNRLKEMEKAKEDRKNILIQKNANNSLIKALSEASELLEGNIYNEDLFKLYKAQNKVECNFDGLIISLDLTNECVRIGCVSGNRTVDLLADGYSDLISELDWHVECDEMINKNLEYAYKALMYAMKNLTEDTQNKKEQLVG